MCEAYKAYFGMPVGDQDKPWAPHFTCEHCKKTLEDEERKPYYPNQKDLNDLIKELGLTKSNAELLTSRLKQWNLLDESVQVTGQRKCHQVFSVGKNNVKWEPLVDPRKLSEAKIKAGVFVGPQIKKIIECSEFPKKLNRKDRAAWNSFVAVVRGFLGNHKDENYVQLVQTLIKNYAAMGCRMSLKIHILDAHLDKFKENMGAYSEEQGERFHQDIMNFECRYQGQYNENMMGDYIWGLIRESDLQYSRKSRKTTHF
ncbi:hypothetical protein SRHO_G00211090 [Serrasalmus rhombeus]